MDGIRIAGKSLGCYGCEGEFASAAELDRHEAETGHGPPCGSCGRPIGGFGADFGGTDDRNQNVCARCWDPKH